MNRYLIPIQNAEKAKSVQRIPIEETPVQIYRRDGDGYDIVAETEGRTIPLGVEDAGVSRKRDGDAPVQLVPTSEGIRVKNVSSTNPITIRDAHREITLDQSEGTTITDNCIVELGIGVEIRVNIRESVSGNGVSDGVATTGEHDDQGIEPAAYVQKVAELIRASAEREAVTDCRKHFQTLHDTVTERPVEDSAYEQVKDDIEQFIARLESRTNNPLRSADGLDDEFIAEVETITDRVETIYARN